MVAKFGSDAMGKAGGDTWANCYDLVAFIPPSTYYFGCWEAAAGYADDAEAAPNYYAAWL